MLAGKSADKHVAARRSAHYDEEVAAIAVSHIVVEREAQLEVRKMSGSLLGEVSVSGQVLASLFSEAASARGDVDGILFGQACISERTVLNDSDGPRPPLAWTLRACVCMPHVLVIMRVV